MSFDLSVCSSSSKLKGLQFGKKKKKHNAELDIITNPQYEDKMFEVTKRVQANRNSDRLAQLASNVHRENGDRATAFSLQFTNKIESKDGKLSESREPLRIDEDDCKMSNDSIVKQLNP